MRLTRTWWESASLTAVFVNRTEPPRPFALKVGNLAVPLRQFAKARLRRCVASL